ncbi:MAG: FGGY-family carbohydrate kinase [Bacteroidota bacterium]
MSSVIAIFDIGKTNKKILLFNEYLKIVFQEEKKFQPAIDDDGDECDDIEKIEHWIRAKIREVISNGDYNLKAVNFSTYGASLMHLDENGRRVTPLYDYLKTMPEGIVEPIYERYGGKQEFLRKTASPALGMLNSGFQILWLKKQKPGLFGKIKHTLHLPNYLSFVLSQKPESEYTSIGCHTAMWDFEEMKYHRWLADEGIASLSQPVSNNTIHKALLDNDQVKVGIGIHDSSASMVPYIMQSREKFILVSTGTWCINMNPFNYEPLTYEQLEKDCLCYLSVSQKPVKSSRLFLGRIHDVNVERLANHFDVDQEHYKKVGLDQDFLPKLSFSKKKFFGEVIPDDLIDTTVDLSEFESFGYAYHQLMLDLTALCKDSIDLIIPQQDDIDSLYISGGFARSELFVRMLATRYPGKKLFTTDIANSTALGAAYMVYGEFGNIPTPKIDLGFREHSDLRSHLDR